ncbi:transcription elongation factor GreA [Patescibacteria group bacterium]|nr:transcription elongation factor GreA [Patescibacteria group bacterium]
MPNFLTPDGRLRIEKEVAELEGKKPQIADRIRAAQEFGDLSENSENTAAKEELAWVQSEIQRLRNLLRSAETVDIKKDSDKIGIGSRVKLKIKNDIKTFTITGAEGADPANNRISYQSPIGEALLGRNLNEKVTIKTPQGQIDAEIVEIE